jgi:hypothetical protein
MAVDERGRLQLAEAAKRAFGDDAGITLMELLPPVGWADVATKQDVAHLEAVMSVRFETVEGRLGILDSKVDDLSREIRAQTWKFVTVMIAVVGAVAAAVRL